MIVPSPTQFQYVPVAGVFSPDMVKFYMKLDPTNYIDLATAISGSGIAPTQGVNYFPNAALVLG